MTYHNDFSISLNTPLQKKNLVLRNVFLAPISIIVHGLIFFNLNRTWCNQKVRLNLPEFCNGKAKHQCNRLYKKKQLEEDEDIKNYATVQNP